MTVIQTDEVVYVVVYEHKHGVDSMVCASESAANEVLVGIITEYIDDVDEPDRSEIKKLLEANDYDALPAAWNEATGYNEVFNVEQRKILDVYKPSIVF